MVEFNFVSEESRGPSEVPTSNAKSLEEFSTTPPAPTLADVARHWSKRTWGIFGLVSGFLASLVTVLILMATGFLTLNTSGVVSLNPELVAKRIQVELEDELIQSTVACPDPIVAPVGFWFECMINTPEGNVSRAQVTISSIVGDVSWFLQTDLPQNITK